MLSGSLPFKGNNENEILEKVVKGQFNFDDSQWKYVSSKAKFLIKDMLDINTQTRVSLFKCIDSPWINMLTKIDGSFRIDG
jgi:serine/threonine protein kinase